jgi:hypothetical protein
LERRWGKPACTNWFPGSDLVPEKSIDWTIKATFFDRDGEDIPLRIGGWDGSASDDGLGFGLAKIEAKHPPVPDFAVIDRVLQDCRPRYDDNQGTWRCNGEGLEIHYATRVDSRSGDGRPVGIITIF